MPQECSLLGKRLHRKFFFVLRSRTYSHPSCRGQRKTLKIPEKLVHPAIVADAHNACSPGVSELAVPAR